MRTTPGLLVVVGLVVSAGCSSGGVVEETHKIADEMCACQDVDCVIAVQPKLKELELRLAKMELTPGHARRVQEGLTRAATCGLEKAKSAMEARQQGGMLPSPGMPVIQLTAKPRTSASPKAPSPSKPSKP